MQVGECDGFAVRDAEAPVHSGGSLEAKSIGTRAATAGVDGFVIFLKLARLRFVRRGSRFGDVFARTSAGIDASGIAQLPPGIEVESSAFALGIWRESTADVRAL